MPLEEDVNWDGECSLAKLSHGYGCSFVQQALVDAGLEDITLIPLGGDKVLVHPRIDVCGAGSQQEMQDLIGNFFVDVKQWTLADDVVYERGAWVCCFGIPVHAWNNIFFAELAESHGRLLKIFECTSNKSRMDYARFMIATPSLKEINVTFQVLIDNRLTSIRLIEDIDFEFASDACLVACDSDNNSVCSAHTRFQDEEPLVNAFVQQIHDDWKTKSEGRVIKNRVSPKQATPLQPVSEHSVMKSEQRVSHGSSKSRKLKKCKFTPSVKGMKKLARLSAADRNALIRSLKNAKRRKSGSSSVKVNSQGKQGTSLTAGSGFSGKDTGSNDWNNWVALHGDEQTTQRDVAVVGNCIGVKCSNSFEVLDTGNEIVDEARRDNKDLLMFKVGDAYDSVDWVYLEDVMLKMNFPSRWRSWIMQCVTTASASVLVNGCPTDEFWFERGLRQGDPLSPFLFLAAEGLNVMMKAMVSENIFTPYVIGARNEVAVSHLQFADDTLLVGVKSWANVRALKAVLLLFESILGLKVNFHKSMLFGINISESWLHEAASVMRCKHGRIPFTYLGLPIGGDPRKLYFWASVGGDPRKLYFWASVVMSSIPVYFLSFFRAPSGKWVWRCLEERDSLWSLVLKAKYGQEGGRVCFAEDVGSVWWRNVNSVRVGVGVRDNRWLVDNICRHVGNGRETLFWLDPWLEECRLQRSFCRLYDLAENKSVSVADMFEVGWGIGGEAWKWRLRLFAWEEELVLGCVGKLANIFLQVDEVDRWVWKLHSSQSYSVKSAYSYLSASETRISDSFDRLPTKDNLQKKVPSVRSVVARDIEVAGHFDGASWCGRCSFSPILRTGWCIKGL
ncbi:hypothetical protein TSUD_400470 [Trifolium subterraneum]|uniref:Reverse transcriptase domain-containing protein n=1 Tax=Trifolium subterraneum TaxID=3900 RepID=A0A2Z6NMG7_TRISU|nr:hypothetical protein TSUD_400470 [Trifolium subterraneum]